MSVVADSNGALPAEPDAHRDPREPIRAIVGWAVRIVVLLLMVEALVLTGRADLFHPSDIGTDSANYAAGGQRIAAGHPLYDLSAGDQPVPADNAPLWSVPLLSPPGVAVLWALPALVGASALAIAAWWLGGAILTLGWTAYAILRGRIGALVLAALVVPMTALTALSGNLNAFLMPLLVATWYLTRDGSSGRRQALAGVLVALGAWTKLTPILILPWLIATRRWRSVTATIAGLAVLGLVGLLAAGWDAHVAYLSIGGQTAAAGATGFGPETLLIQMGASPAVARLVPVAVTLLVLVLVALFRDRPAWGFAVAVAGVILASPVLRFESYSMLLAAAAPWVESDGIRLGDLVANRRIWLVGLLAALLVGSSVAVLVSQAGSNSARVTNLWSQPVVVRFALTGQSASFGFSVPAAGSGSGWGTQAGLFRGDVIVYDASCRQILRAPVTAGAIAVQIDADGQASVGPPASTSGSFGAAGSADHQPLVFTSQCSEQLGPARP